MTKPTQFTQTLRSWMDVFMHRSMRGWGHFAKSTGLSMPQFSILMQLHHKGACGISDISERFDVSNAAASQLVDKLVQADYIKRVEDPSDRRAKVLTMSTRGDELIKRGTEERYVWMDELATKISAEERDKVSEALEILIRAVQQLEEKNDLRKTSSVST